MSVVFVKCFHVCSVYRQCFLVFWYVSWLLLRLGSCVNLLRGVFQSEHEHHKYVSHRYKTFNKTFNKSMHYQVVHVYCILMSKTYLELTFLWLVSFNVIDILNWNRNILTNFGGVRSDSRSKSFFEIQDGGSRRLEFWPMFVCRRHRCVLI